MAAKSQPVHKEKARSVVRALHLGRLESAGTARASALQEAEQHLDQIARALPAALQAGLTLTEIARATGVSRPTLYELRARYSDAPMDLSLGVLQTIASHGPITEADLRARINRAPKEISRTMADFQRQFFIDFDVEEHEDGKSLIYFLTGKGYELLEHWTFEDIEAEESAR